jgi:Gly-Xaa carboxypeptidase
MIQCLGVHSSSLPKSLAKAIHHSVKSDKALKQVQDFFFQFAPIKASAQTTTAVDIIGGGVKVNSLPEQAWAAINHRIDTASSISDTQTRDTDVFREVAEKFNLTYTAFGHQVRNGSNTMTLTVDNAFNGGLEPAPITPTAGDEAAAYRLLSKTIKGVYNSHRGLGSEDSIIVSPGISTGNTGELSSVYFQYEILIHCSDTHFYWSLTKNIFRYNRQDYGAPLDQGLPGFHT